MKGFIAQTVLLGIGAVLVAGVILYLSFNGKALAQLSIFDSIQVGTNPTDGYVLQTDGTDSSWVATSSLGISGGEGSGLATTSIDTESELESIVTDVTDIFTNNDGTLADDDLSDDDLDALQNVAAMTEASGDILYYNTSWTRLPKGSDGEVLKLSSGLPSWGTDNEGAGGGEANDVSTSTNETAGNLAYWTSNSATPALLGQVATTSATIGSGLSYSGTFGSLIGGSSGSLTLDTTGDWTGTLDGIEGANFLRSDVADTAAGTITFSNGFLSTASSTITDVLHADGTIDFQNLYNIDAEQKSGINRLIFKSSEGNADAELFAAPVGSNVGSEFTFSDSPNANNFGGVQVGTDGTDNFLSATSSGTGTLHPIRLRMHDTNIISIGTDDTIDFDQITTNGLLQTTGSDGSVSASTTISQAFIDSAIARDSELHDAVTLAGTLDYLTLSGQEITRNAINLTTDVTGTLPVGNGGSGATTLSGVLFGNGASAFTATTSLSTNYVENLSGTNTGDVTLSGTPDYITLSGQDIVRGTVDISDDTNLSGDSEIVLTGDALSIAASIARDSELHDAVTLAGENYLSLSTQQITANAITAANLDAADFGDFTCNGTTCSFDADTVGTSELDLSISPTWTGTHTFATTSHSKLTVSGNTFASSTIYATANSNDLLLRAYENTGGEYYDIGVDSSGSLFFTDDASNKLLSITNGADSVDISTALGHIGDADTYLAYGVDQIDLVAGGVFFLDIDEGATDTAVALGEWDFGGATSLEIPNGTDPSTNVTGEIAVNTSTSSIRFHDGTAERALYTVEEKTFTIASSTLDAFEGQTASSTIPLGTASIHGETWEAVTCFTHDTGTAELEFGDNTNWMDYQKLTTAATRDSSLSNNTFTRLEKRFVRVGQVASAPDSITCTVEIRRLAD